MKNLYGLKCRLTKIAFLAFLLFYITIQAIAEGSGTWGHGINGQSMLWYAENSGSGNGGYTKRGFMLLPSTDNRTGSTYENNYDPGHRLYVFVKSGETVFWGFHAVQINNANPNSNAFGSIRVNWYYDTSDTGFFPDAKTTAQGRTVVSTTNNGYAYTAGGLTYKQYDANGTGTVQGKPNTASQAEIGPSQISVNTGGYSAHYFTNITGEDRAFWIEISDPFESDRNFASGFHIDFWDITVASGSAGNYVEKPGRVYSKFWSISNGRETPASTILNGINSGQTDATSFSSDFGFYVPVENSFSPATNDYFIKRIRVPGGIGGWTNFFANSDGPRNDLSFAENRKSRPGTSSNFQYPLFLNDPDSTIWQSTIPPTATLEINYNEKPPPLTGGEAIVGITISLPAVVDVLVDLNGNSVFDDGIDLIISQNYNGPGTYQIYWNGEDASGNELESGSDVEFFATVTFFPVHFPIYDIEQSLGIRITNIRPGMVEDNALFWDDSSLPRTGIVNGMDLAASAKSSSVNVTGEEGPNHIWWTKGDNGFGDNNTINTWSAAYYTEVKEREGFNFLTIAGNVFEDVDSLANGRVDGDPVSFSGLYAVLIKADGTVGRVTAVQADGSFLMRKVANGDFKIILTMTPPSLGDSDPGPSLPADWIHTGEFLGSGPGSDSGVDGYLDEFNVQNSSVVNANFGIIDLRILPVSWLYFLGKAQNEQIMLEWATAQEQNNDYFLLERSPDGKEWKSLNMTTSTGNSQVVSEYQGLDPMPVIGKNYYRLAQVDVDGKSIYSQVIWVDYDPEWEIRVFPNPFIEEISLRAKELQDFKINMTDMQGRNIPLRLKAGEINKLTIETNELTTGVYILTLRNNWKTYSRKLVKQ